MEASCGFISLLPSPSYRNEDAELESLASDSTNAQPSKTAKAGAASVVAASGKPRLALLLVGKRFAGIFRT